MPVQWSGKQPALLPPAATGSLGGCSRAWPRAVISSTMLAFAPKKVSCNSRSSAQVGHRMSCLNDSVKVAARVHVPCPKKGSGSRRTSQGSAVCGSCFARLGTDAAAATPAMRQPHEMVQDQANGMVQCKGGDEHHRQHHTSPHEPVGNLPAAACAERCHVSHHSDVSSLAQWAVCYVLATGSSADTCQHDCWVPVCSVCTSRLLHCWT